MYVLMDVIVFCVFEIDYKFILVSSIYKLIVEVKNLWVREVD